MGDQLRTLVVTGRTFACLGVLASLLGECRAAPPPDALVKKLTEVIREKCPEAEIQVGEEEFVAKHGTIKLKVHGVAKTGEISESVMDVEGPNYQGFLLRVRLEAGPYRGAAVVPQTLQRQYFPVYVDAPATEDGKGHYWMSFAYGSRLDSKLKGAIFEALPRSMRLPAKPVPAEQPKEPPLTQLEGVLRIHPKFKYKYYLTVSGSGGQTCALFGSPGQERDPELLSKIRPGSVVRVSGRIGVVTDSPRRAGDLSPFEDGSVIFLNVEKAEVLWVDPHSPEVRPAVPRERVPPNPAVREEQPRVPAELPVDRPAARRLQLQERNPVELFEETRTALMALELSFPLLDGLSEIQPTCRRDAKGELELVHLSIEKNSGPPDKRGRAAKDPDQPFVSAAITVWRHIPQPPERVAAIWGVDPKKQAEFQWKGVHYRAAVSVYSSDPVLVKTVYQGLNLVEALKAQPAL